VEFYKYLIDSDGNLVKNYPSAIDPLDTAVLKDVENELRRVKF
jgi:glutathione peroxidase-family protein